MSTTMKLSLYRKVKALLHDIRLISEPAQDALLTLLDEIYEAMSDDEKAILDEEE